MLSWQARICLVGQSLKLPQNKLFFLPSVTSPSLWLRSPPLLWRKWLSYAPRRQKGQGHNSAMTGPPSIPPWFTQKILLIRCPQAFASTSTSKVPISTCHSSSQTWPRYPETHKFRVCVMLSLTCLKRHITLSRRRCQKRFIEGSPVKSRGPSTVSSMQGTDLALWKLRPRGRSVPTPAARGI